MDLLTKTVMISTKVDIITEFSDVGIAECNFCVTEDQIIRDNTGNDLHHGDIVIVADETGKPLGFASLVEEESFRGKCYYCPRKKFLFRNLKAFLHVFSF